MAEASVKSFLQKLDSILIHENEAFDGLENQVESIVNKFKEILRFFDHKGSTREDNNIYSWFSDVKVVIKDTENHIQGFILQKHKKHEIERATVNDCFTYEMLKIETHLEQIIKRVMQLNTSTSSESLIDENTQSLDIGQTSVASSSYSFEKNYMNLPHHLQNCLLYCCIFPENYWIPKGKLILLLVAEDMIQETERKLIEDVAKEYINQLINQGMLHVCNENLSKGTKLQVHSGFWEFCRCKIEEGHFKTSLSSSDASTSQKARHVSTNLDTMNIHNHPLHSLFLLGKKEPFEENRDWLQQDGAKLLKVLDLENSKIRCLPDEVGDLIHLKYLGLKHTDITELPPTLGNLRALQTLDIRWCRNITELPLEILNLDNLRHLKMFKNRGLTGVKLPAGIGRLRNLLTLTGITASGCTARELGDLLQLRKLRVVNMAEDEDNIRELFSSIMKMQNLLGLSLETKHTFIQGKLIHGKLFLFQSFSPPPLLEKLHLGGLLGQVPNWLGSMEGLTTLRLGYSHLTENPTVVVQLLPNLKTLTLWHAYDAKQIGKEFCRAGGFPRLEVLSIASHVLEEWTEIEEGAFPRLKCLNFHNCLQMQMLPEGLQFVTTLKQLNLLPLRNNHADRLKPDGGEENYKIRHIPRVSFITTSIVTQLFDDRTRET